MDSHERKPTLIQEDSLFAAQQQVLDLPTPDDSVFANSTSSPAEVQSSDHVERQDPTRPNGDGFVNTESDAKNRANGQDTSGQHASQSQLPLVSVLDSTIYTPVVPSVKNNDWPKQNGLMRKLSRSVKKPEPVSSGPVTRWTTASGVKPKTDELRMPLVPQLLQVGISVLRVTHRKRSPRTFSMDPATAVMSWDAKSSARLCVDDIRDTRVGDDARNYREEFKVSGHFADRWMSAIYQKEKMVKALHLIFPTAEMLSTVVACLLALKEYRHDVMVGLASTGGDISATQLGNSREQLDLEAVERLCKQVHINAGRGFLRDSFIRADVQGKGVLGIGEFRQFVGLLKERKELSYIWRRKIAGTQEESNDSVTLDFTGFWRFLLLKQASSMSREDAQLVFSKFSQDGKMTYTSFTSYLLSSYNPAQVQKQEDMSQALNEYYISSSHNTYLLGRQIRGESSIEGYIRVLQRGCRCVEIDCWDGPDTPIVTHGRTLSSLVSFRDVIATIAKYAFVTSPYPLLLSLEVHCNKEQQLMMVYCLRDVFGSKLVTQSIVNDEGVLPSPMDLRHRILVKIKWSEGDDEPSTTSELTTSTSTTDTTENEEFESTSSGKVKTKRSSRIIEVLSELAVYSKGLKFRNFALPESKTMNHVFSFSERSFNSLVKDQDKLAQLEKHNTRYLMRVYPSGYRITSSNFDPLPFWRRGVQMVALNWQTYDLGIQINDALFLSSDKAGYVLKPQVLRTPQAKVTSESKRIKIKIEVISAQQLPRPKEFKSDDSFDPYVGVEILWEGLVYRDRTQSVKGNGFNPIWKEKFKYDFFTNFQELVFIRFSLLNEEKSRSKEDKSAVFATYSSSLMQLQQGYRHIPMYDLQGEQFLFSTLFVKIKTEFI